MLHTGQTKDLFQLQSELVDMKVDMAVNTTIDRVVEQIHDLRSDMHDEMRGLRSDMNNQFSSLDKRVSSLEHRFIAVETKLGIANETRGQIKAKFIDYSFKAGWLILGSILTYVIVQFNILIN